MHPPFLAPPLEQKKEKRQPAPAAKVAQEPIQDWEKYQRAMPEFWNQHPTIDVNYRAPLTTAGTIAGLAYTTSPVTASQSYNAMTVIQKSQNQ